MGNGKYASVNKRRLMTLKGLNQYLVLTFDKFSFIDARGSPTDIMNEYSDELLELL
jgi:hypothetical protein